MANITRDQWDEDKGVTKKILQKGVVLTDADWNEQADVLKNDNRRTLSSLVGYTNVRFGNGFKVAGVSGNLQVVVYAGFGAFQIANKTAVLLRLAENDTISGFSAWTEERTDYVYLDIEEKEISSADDPNIINPDIGEETCRDMRISYSFEISEGAEPGSPPEGHVYISIATVTKIIGSTINPDDVTVLIDDFYVVNENAVVTDSIMNNAITTDKIANDAITSEKIKDGEVKNNNIADDAVICGKIGADAIIEENIVNGSVSTDKLCGDAVTTPKISNDAVTSDKIVNGAIIADKIAADAVNKTKIASDVAGTGLTQDDDGSLKVDGILAYGSSNEIKMKVIEIGAWNMYVDESKLVTHGLNSSKIRAFQACIIPDVGTPLKNIDYAGSGTTVSGFMVVHDSNVLLQRMTDGYFYNTDYDDPTMNRGYVTIWYEA